jgi:hypothetical protein
LGGNPQRLIERELFLFALLLGRQYQALHFPQGCVCGGNVLVTKPSAAPPINAVEIVFQSLLFLSRDGKRLVKESQTIDVQFRRFRRLPFLSGNIEID